MYDAGQKTQETKDFKLLHFKMEDNLYENSNAGAS